MNKKLYCVWMHNMTSSKDDEAIKVRASSIEEAAEIASRYQPYRFRRGRVYTLGDFRACTGWPHTMAQPYNYSPMKRKKRKKN